MKKELTCTHCNTKFERRVYIERNQYFCSTECYGYYRKKNGYISFQDTKTATIFEVKDIVKNVLPVIKNMSEYKKYCKKVSDRFLSDEVNPYS